MKRPSDKSMEAARRREDRLKQINTKAKVRLKETPDNVMKKLGFKKGL